MVERKRWNEEVEKCTMLGIKKWSEKVEIIEIMGMKRLKSEIIGMKKWNKNWKSSTAEMMGIKRLKMWNGGNEKLKMVKSESEIIGMWWEW